MELPEITAAIKQEIEARGTNPYRAAREARLPDNSIRYVLDGHEPRAGRLIEICHALGLELYVGPPRKSGAKGADAQSNHIREQAEYYGDSLPSRPSTPVRDRRLAEMITVLTEQWEVLNEVGPASSADEIRHVLPGPSKACPVGASRRMARLARHAERKHRIGHENPSSVRRGLAFPDRIRDSV